MSQLFLQRISPLAPSTTVGIDGLAFKGPVVDITHPDYGADPTFASDSLGAINAAARDLAAAGGGVLYYPRGKYKVSAAPTYPTGVPIILKGDGRARSIVKHATGGSVLNWTFNHVASEFGGGIEDLGFDGNGGSATAATITNATLFCLRRVFVTNSNGIGTALNLTSCWDSEFANIYVQDAGDSTHPASVFDTLASGGFNGNTFNNCHFYDYHVELSGQDCIFLQLLGNATNDLDDLHFFNLKLHGNAATSMPNRQLLDLSQYTNGNTFVSSIIAYGKGTAQIVDDGQRNTFYKTSFGIGGGNPTYAVQCTANSNGHTQDRANIKTPSLYGSANVPFRVESGSIHNDFHRPNGNFAGVASIVSDAGGRSSATWVDLGSARGLRVYHGEGMQWVSTQVMDPAVTPTWGASIAIQNFNSRKFLITATSNIAATVATPTSAPQSGQVQRISLTFRNTSGGALGAAIAFSAGYKTSGTVSPANNTQITVDFDYDPVQSVWVEASRSAQV